jgi:hypothetical protein
VSIALDLIIWSTPNRVAEWGQELNQDRGRVGFGMWFDLANDFAGKTTKSFLADRVRPIIGLQ